MAQVAPQKMTSSQYAKLGETMQPMELIEGEIVMAPAPLHSHQKLALAFTDLLKSVAPNGERGIAPDDVYLDQHNVPQPDVFWVSSTNSACKLGADGRWHGPPDMIIEILSPTSVLRDRREKFTLYEKHGVQEYWIADPASQVVEVYRLEKRKYQRIGVFGRGDNFESSVLKAKIELSRVFDAPE